jgi:folate-binding protein YgfZ
MDRVSQEAQFLQDAVGVRRRDDLAVIHITGDDRLSWLNGQVTNDVRNVKPGAGVYALAVTVRGKIMTDLWVLERGERLAIVLPRTTEQRVLASFEQQIIMEDVELVPAPAVRVISAQGPAAATIIEGVAPELEIHQCDELGRGGWLGIAADDTTLQHAWTQLVQKAERVGGGEVSDAGFELARLRAGRPRFGVDFSDSHYPQEVGLVARAVSFNKGCYLGQEVVCTLENRGRASRRLVALAMPTDTAPAAGAAVCDTGGQVVGQLTSTCVDPTARRALALGYVKAAASDRGTRLQIGDSEATLLGVVGEN